MKVPFMNEHITQVAADMPYLRRFARVLTGSREVGDSYALAALEAALTEPTFDSATDARERLYQALVTAWEPIARDEVAFDVRAAPKTLGVDVNLTVVAPLPRAAFLLQSMEEFDIDQVAVILRRSVSDVEHLIDQAGEELAAQISSDVLITKDERMVSSGL